MPKSTSRSPASTHHSPVESSSIVNVANQEFQTPSQSRPVTLTFIALRLVTPIEERKRLEKKSIYAKGFVLGTVSWKTDPIPGSILPQGALQSLGWSNDESNMRRTMYGGLSSQAAGLMRDTPSGHVSTKDILERNPKGIMSDYNKRAQTVTWNRVVLEATDNDIARDQGNTKVEPLIGIGPLTTENGDLVYYFR
ncbi:hypothetical protein GGS24DRAFT_502128 [Hypoxylon argillaceum]|nr:hypothetical protein GGS24DRAFT_502128 [Hypoxylon argillaceum]